MSANSQTRTFTHTVIYVRYAPESRHLGRGCNTSAYDPKRTSNELPCLRATSVENQALACLPRTRFKLLFALPCLLLAKKPRRPAAKDVLKGYRPEEFYCEMFGRRGLGHTRRIRERLERLDLAALRRRARDALRPGAMIGPGQGNRKDTKGMALPLRMPGSRCAPCGSRGRVTAMAPLGKLANRVSAAD